MISKKDTVKKVLQVNNYQVTFDVVNILELVNNINSRLAKVERHIENINNKGVKK